jgi:hypothetical protein
MKTPLFYLFSIVLCAYCLFSCQSSQKEEEKEWFDLFNGESLEGWVLKEAEGNFFVEDGMITSITDSTSPNCYLAYEKEFSDFVLELDFKVEPPLNSGVQIRSIIRDKDATVMYMNGRMEEKEVTFTKGTAVGYQIEIDPSDRAWSGGLYEPGGRGWLQNLEGKPDAQRAYKKDDWNHFKIVAKGDHIQTWVNGVPAIDAHDAVYPKGFIGFQMHSAYNKEQVGKRMYWKNIRIREL